MYTILRQDNLHFRIQVGPRRWTIPEFSGDNSNWPTSDALCVDKRHKKKRKWKHNDTRSEPEFIRKFVQKKEKITRRKIRRKIQLIFAATFVGTDYFETMPSFALGSSPGLFAFTMSIAHSVPHSPISLTDTRADGDSSKARLFLKNSRNKRGVSLSLFRAHALSLCDHLSLLFLHI